MRREIANKLKEEKMKLILLAAAVTFVVTCLASGQSAKQNRALEQKIREIDLAQADAVLRSDLPALDKLWAADFVVNNPFNEIDKADRIRSGAVTYSSFVRDIEKVLIHGDTVIVMGRETVVPKGKSPDAGKTIHRRYINIWMKRKGKWMLTARQSSVICEN